MIKIAFRLDDPSETSHQGVESSIVEVLRRRAAVATFATIPYRKVDGERRPLTPQRAETLTRAAADGVIEIALHGYLHVRLAPAPSPPTEFAGLPLEDQLKLISAGKSHLESIFSQPISGFVPPWNSFDTNTLKALEALGFQYLAAGRDYPRAYGGPVRLIPRTAHLTDLQCVISEAHRFAPANPVFVVVLHHYDFAESGEKEAVTNIHGFDNFLARILDLPDVRICSLKEIADDLSISNESFLKQQSFSRHPLTSRFLPQRSMIDAPIWRGFLSGLKKS